MSCVSASSTCRLEACFWAGVELEGPRLLASSHRIDSPCNGAWLNPVTFRAAVTLAHQQSACQQHTALLRDACSVMKGARCILSFCLHSRDQDSRHQCAAALLRSPFGRNCSSGFSKRTLRCPSRSQIWVTWSLISTISPPASFSSPAWIRGVERKVLHLFQHLRPIKCLPFYQASLCIQLQTSSDKIGNAM